MSIAFQKRQKEQVAGKTRAKAESREQRKAAKHSAKDAQDLPSTASSDAETSYN